MISAVKFLYFIVLLSKAHCDDQSASTPAEAPTKPTEIVTYQIVKQTGENPFRFNLLLGGSTYSTRGKICRIMKSSKTGEAITFTEIGACPENDSDSGSNDKCVRACSGDNIKIEFNKLSPRTNYIYIFSGDSATSVNTATQQKGGKVFGLSTPLLANPQIFVSTDSSTKKLKLATKTCPPVDCPINYKDMKYGVGTKESDCDTTTTSANSVDFDLFIPHYEVRCIDYPVFFYNMPNEYMKREIDIYNPQFYLIKKVNNPKNVTLIFTNSPSHEICLFRMKDAAVTAKNDDYESNCGNEDGECYAPCRNVRLIVSAPKQVYTISIQTRHHDPTKKSDNTYDGFNQNKYAITLSRTQLLSYYTKTGVTFNSELFKAGSGATPTLSHYAADKLKPDSLLNTQCADGSSINSGNKGNCKNVGAKLVVTDLEAGKPYTIEISSLGISDPRDFKEKIFFRTKKSDDKDFDKTAASTTTSDASLKAVAGTIGSDSTKEPTCEYQVSLSEKDYFYPAKCEDSNPCRGWCKDMKNIVDLEPGIHYDIKVIAHKDYGEHIFSGIQMKLATLNITHQFTLDGFELNAKLSTNTEALCQYEVQINWVDRFDTVYVCPAPTQSPQAVGPQSTKESEPSSNPILPKIPSMRDIFNKVLKNNVQTAEKSTVKETPDHFKLARAGGSVTEGSKISSSISTCTSMPLCSSIVFNTDYHPRYPYKVLVAAFGKSNQESVDLPSNRLKSNPIDTNYVVDVSISREESTFNVKATHPTKINEESKCKWELRNSSAKSNLKEKSCLEEGPECPSFPKCKSFDINDIPEANNYHLVVYYVDDDTYYGIATINQGEKNSATLIVASIVGVVVLIGIFGTACKKKDAKID